MIPVNPEGEEMLFEIESILLDLLEDYRGKDATRTTLIALQMNLNEIAKKFLPLIVEEDGQLWVLVGYSTKFTEEGAMYFTAKLMDDSEIILDFFRGKVEANIETKGLNAD